MNCRNALGTKKNQFKRELKDKGEIRKLLKLQPMRTKILLSSSKERTLPFKNYGMLS